jgi:predicted nucleic acid-binding protein
VIYFDTSALVKRFVNENGSDLVQSLVQSATAVATAKIAYAELYAGLTRKLRERNLSKARQTVACRQFESDWHAYVRVELMDDVLLLVRVLIQRHPLKGFDAVHLASALQLKSALDKAMRFAAADRNLLKAAQAENLEAVNVEAALVSK